jgi:hypothetical protein
MLVRRLASGNLGAFRFSGENFQAVPIAPAIRPSPQFRLNYLKCPSLLAWIDDVPSYWMGRQILQSVNLLSCLLVHKPNIEIRHAADRVTPVGDSPELQLKLCILRSPTAFNNNVGCPVVLVLLPKPSLQTFHGKS